MQTFGGTMDKTTTSSVNHPPLIRANSAQCLDSSNKITFSVKDRKKNKSIKSNKKASHKSQDMPHEEQNK